jgi:hypothetical protein
LFLLLGQSVLGLGDFEFPFTLESDETDSEVGTAQIDGEVFPRLGPFWVLRFSSTGRVSELMIKERGGEGDGAYSEDESRN